MKLITALFIAVLFSGPTFAIGKAEFCKILTEMFVKALEMREAELPRQKAIESLLKEYAGADPIIVGDVDNVVGFAYDDEPTSKEIYYDVCISL